MKVNVRLERYLSFSQRLLKSTLIQLWASAFQMGGGISFLLSDGVFIHLMKSDVGGSLE